MVHQYRHKIALQGWILCARGMQNHTKKHLHSHTVLEIATDAANGAHNETVDNNVVLVRVQSSSCWSARFSNGKRPYILLDPTDTTTKFPVNHDR